MVKPPMEASDAPRRPTAGSEPPTQPRRVIIGENPRKRASRFTQFSLGEYELGLTFDGMPTMLITAALIVLVLLAVAFIPESKNRHSYPKSPPICARGYEI